MNHHPQRKIRDLAPRLQYWESRGGSENPALVIQAHLADGGDLSPEAIRQLSARLEMPEATLRGIASYYADLRSPSEDQAGMLVCEGTSCQLAGARQVRSQLEEQGKQCQGVYCLGYCDRSPAVLDASKGLFIGDQAAKLEKAEAHLPDIRCATDRPIVTARLNGSAVSLAKAREAGAYLALEKALRAEPAKVLDEMEDSGERGRGGAGFSTGRKWRACAETEAPLRYVIANGDEGDPGSYIDRVLMEKDPHGILEGMALCAYAVGASQGILYVRSEYPNSIRVLQNAIHEAQEAGYLGETILGTSFSFEVQIFPGMGSYVCGEETAMINAIEGLRGEVQIRPPYPTQQGLYGMPTVVNNVETLINVPFIVREGAEAYRQFGTEASSGTKALCLNHGFAKPGIVEVPFGISLRSVIEDWGGGSRDGQPLAAVIIGGPMGSMVLPKDWDVPVCYETMAERGIQLGHGGLVAIPEDADFRGLLEHWIQFMIDESCGKCVPCRLGSQCASNVLLAHKDRESAEARLNEVFTAMEMGSLCAFGQFMPGPMRQLIEHFGDRIF